MTKALKEIIKKKEREHIEAHMPAKDAVILPDEERSDIEAFEEAYDKAWVDSRDTSRNIEDDGFHASSLGVYHGKCARRNVYLLRSVEKRGHIAPRIMRVFGNGHAVHDRIQKQMEAMGINMRSEVPIVHDMPPIRGHADGIINWRGREILIEIKSCSDEVFVNRLKWKKPKDDHFDQANIYAYILGLDTIWIIYENKNTQETKFFEKKTNSEAAKKIIDSWHAQWLMVQDGSTPKRPYKPDSSICGGCDVKYHCFADPEVGVTLNSHKKQVEALHAQAE